MGKLLCVYFSRSGLTKEVMTRLAGELQADLFSYTDDRDYSGVLGYIRGCFEAILKKERPIRTDMPMDLSAYDAVVVGMPLWVEKPSVVGVNFLKQYKHLLPEKTFLLVTHMAEVSYEDRIRNLGTYMNTAPAGFLSLCTKGHDNQAEILEFAAKIREAL